MHQWVQIPLKLVEPLFKQAIKHRVIKWRHYYCFLIRKGVTRFWLTEFLCTIKSYSGVHELKDLATVSLNHKNYHIGKFKFCIVLTILYVRTDTRFFFFLMILKLLLSG